MALKLENEFVVAAPVEPTWRTLLDLQRVARCLPGATVEPGAEEGEFLGSMRVKLGPITMDYKGTARIERADESTRVAVFAVQGKEARGQGSASATISNRLIEAGGSTKVLVETELSVTGRPAQFGRGIMQDVAARMLADFSACLSKMMSEDARDGSSRSQEATEAAPETVPDAAGRPAELDLTRTVRGVLGRRIVTGLGLAALGGFLAKLIRRHRS